MARMRRAPERKWQLSTIILATALLVVIVRTSSGVKGGAGSILSGEAQISASDPVHFDTASSSIAHPSGAEAQVEVSQLPLPMISRSRVLRAKGSNSVDTVAALGARTIVPGDASVGTPFVHSSPLPSGFKWGSRDTDAEMDRVPQAKPQIKALRVRDHPPQPNAIRWGKHRSHNFQDELTGAVRNVVRPGQFSWGSPRRTTDALNDAARLRPTLPGKSWADVMKLSAGFNGTVTSVERDLARVNRLAKKKSHGWPQVRKLDVGLRGAVRKAETDLTQVESELGDVARLKGRPNSGGWGSMLNGTVLKAEKDLKRVESKLGQMAAAARPAVVGAGFNRTMLKAKRDVARMESALGDVAILRQRALPAWDMEQIARMAKLKRNVSPVETPELPAPPPLRRR